MSADCLTVNGVSYDLTPAMAEGLFSCYQNLKRKKAHKSGLVSLSARLAVRLEDVRYVTGNELGLFGGPYFVITPEESGNLHRILATRQRGA